MSENEDYTDTLGGLRRLLNDVYMRKRIHSALGYLTPLEFEERRHGKHRRLYANHQRKPKKCPVSGVYCSTFAHTIEGAYAEYAALPNTMARSNDYAVY